MRFSNKGVGVIFTKQRADTFGGTGFLGGLPPDAETEHDGRARVLNEPARVDITVFEPNTYTVVARTWSRPDGAWRVPYLNESMQFTVIATDRSRQVNSAIQDWVLPAAMPVTETAKAPWIELRLPEAAVGKPWRGDALLRDASGSWASPVITGLPAWVTASVHDTGIVLRGTPDVVGVDEIEVSATVGGVALESGGSLVVSTPKISAVRLVVTANAGHSTYVSVSELEVRGSAGGATLCVGGTWFESSSANAENSALYAFDGSMVNKWTAVRPTVSVAQSFGYTFAAPIDLSAVHEVAIGAPLAGQETMAPTAFVVEFQIGGVWTPVVTRTSETGWVAGQFKVYEV